MLYDMQPHMWRNIIMLFNPEPRSWNPSKLQALLTCGHQILAIRKFSLRNPTIKLFSTEETSYTLARSSSCCFPAFGSKSHSPDITPSIARIIGCNVLTPLAWAIAPTMKGKIAPPEPPSAVPNPMLPTCKCLGKSFVTIIMAVGNNGPKNTPKNATATADTTRDGMSQNMSSSARHIPRYNKTE